MGGASAGPGHRTHEFVLDRPDGSWANGRDGRDQGRRLRRHILKAWATSSPCCRTTTHPPPGRSLQLSQFPPGKPTVGIDGQRAAQAIGALTFRHNLRGQPEPIHF
jgi:hypothetical protein